jgi:predicted RNase H-like nuclease (RuvC/YqgF family)
VAILGLDISGRGAFAYTVVDNGVVVEQGVKDVVGIIKIIKKYKPNILVIDSISELFENGKLIVKAIGRAPFNIDVVQATKVGEESLSVEELVRRNFGVSKGHLTPLETSMYLALLAEKGVGTKVKLYEEETVVLIKRRSSTAPGGMSRNRYMRNIRHRIRDLAEEISRRLNEVGLDYDLFFREEAGDITSARFIVYARRDLVRRYVKPLRSSDVVIDIFSEPVKSREAEAQRGEAYLIVGVDPGIVTGIALMDLNGRVLHTEARRNLSRGDALRRIYQWGVPVVVATDVASPPDYAKKLAAMCGAVLYHPDRDLLMEEKAAIAERLGYSAPTTHERDALAAAYKAFSEFKVKFDKLEKDFGSILSIKQLSRAKMLIAKGKSIAQAVAEVLKEEAAGGSTRVVYVPIERPCKDVDEELRGRVKALEYENSQLSKEVEELRREVAALRRALEDSTWRDLKYREMQQRIESLTKSLQECASSKESLAEEVLDLIQGVLAGRYKLYKEDEVVECRLSPGGVCRDYSSIEELIRSNVLGVPLNLVVVKKIKGYYVIDEQKRIEVLNKVREGLAKKEVDLKRLIEEYRRRAY